MGKQTRQHKKKNQKRRYQVLAAFSFLWFSSTLPEFLTTVTRRLGRVPSEGGVSCLTYVSRTTRFPNAFTNLLPWIQTNRDFLLKRAVKPPALAVGI